MKCEKYRLRVFENKLQRIIFVTEMDKVALNKVQRIIFVTEMDKVALNRIKMHCYKFNKPPL
jgi:CRISPR/Cas system-associated endoribonuclease Cas2